MPSQIEPFRVKGLNVVFANRRQKFLDHSLPYDIEAETRAWSRQYEVFPQWPGPKFSETGHKSHRRIQLKKAYHQGVR